VVDSYDNSYYMVSMVIRILGILHGVAHRVVCGDVKKGIKKRAERKEW
jgi:hypothetical protein